MAARRQQEGTAPADRERGRLAENGTMDCGPEMWLISIGIEGAGAGSGLLSWTDIGARHRDGASGNYPARWARRKFRRVWSYKRAER
jgi:hypothetical protein